MAVNFARLPAAAEGRPHVDHPVPGQPRPLVRSAADRGFLLLRPLAPMRRAHVNYATCPYFDPATVTEATGKLNSVLAV